jgi:hypothetical protein
LFDLRTSAVYSANPCKPAILSLGLTKSGKRAGAAESVTIHVQDVVHRLYHWKKSNTPQTPLVPSSHRWRDLFKRCLSELKLEEFQFRPYSLRRGGATFWFGKHGSFDKLLTQGRWQAARTARIYLNEGLAILAELKLPSKHLKPMVNVYLNAARSSAEKLEQTPVE